MQHSVYHLLIAFTVSFVAVAAKPPLPDLSWPPTLPDGAAAASDTSTDFLRSPITLAAGATIAQAPPTIDFVYYPCQTYPGNPWSVWGDGLATDGNYYSAVGDHMGPQGNAFVFEYDPTARSLRQIVDVRALLQLPDGHYTPGKIHSRIDKGRDGWLYFSTHRGSTRTTTAEFHYRGDWILRHHPATGVTEVVAHAPLPNQCLPASMLDPERLIYYAGTADGDPKVKRVQFLAYDIEKHRVLYSDDNGPPRYMIFAPSTGRLYFAPQAPPTAKGEEAEVEQLLRFDPAAPGKPVAIDARLGLRAATHESRAGKVYTVDRDALWEFDTRSEKARLLGPLVVGKQTYITSLDLDPKTERYLYFAAGAHGGSQEDGTPLVQYDLTTGTRKVIAFLHPFYHERYGFVPIGTFSSAIAEDGSTVFVTWNGNRGATAATRDGKLDFNTCAMTAIHIPASERLP